MRCDLRWKPPKSASLIPKEFSLNEFLQTHGSVRPLETRWTITPAVQLINRARGGVFNEISTWIQSSVNPVISTSQCHSVSSCVCSECPGSLQSHRARPAAFRAESHTNRRLQSGHEERRQRRPQSHRQRTQWVTDYLELFLSSSQSHSVENNLKRKSLTRLLQNVLIL